MVDRKLDNRAAIAWATVAGVAGLDILWAGHVGLTIHGVARPLIATVSLLALSAAYRRRCRRLSDASEAAALWIAFTPVCCILTYLCAAVARPLQDAALADIDQTLGFDWAAWRQLVLDNFVMHYVLAAAYDSLLAQILFAIVFLSATGRAERGIELVLLALWTVLAVSAISALCPALGPRPAGFDYLSDLLTLRNPGPWAFELSDMKGIVSMPSYHTTLAILFTYAFRGIGAVGRGIGVLNAIMLVAIPPFGDHYLCDVAAGAAIAVVAIAGLRAADSLPLIYVGGKTGSQRTA